MENRSSPLAACGALLALVALVGLARGYRREAPPDPSEDREVEVASSPAVALAPDQPLDLNRASAAELELLPRIGPRLAERIVAARTRAGRFRTVEDLERVPGIGPQTLARIRPLVRVGPSPSP